MSVWNVQVLPAKNVIRLYQSGGPLSKIKDDSTEHRKSINHIFVKNDQKEVLKEAESILEQSGYTLVKNWAKDINFNIWHNMARYESDK